MTMKGGAQALLANAMLKTQLQLFYYFLLSIFCDTISLNLF